MDAVDFAHRTRATLVGLVVEIDREHRGIAPDLHVAPVRLVDLEDLVVDQVLPAMVLELARHGGLRFHSWRISLSANRCPPRIKSGTDPGSSPGTGFGPDMRYSYRTLRPKS